MKAMILAAGHGARMRPLTDNTPKPMLKIAGKPLIVWHIERLKAAGIRDFVINIAWQGWQIPEALGNGLLWQVNIRYSDEQQEGALETAGGIVKALPLLGNQPFIVVNGDIWCDYPYATLSEPGADLAHLVLVNNPEHNPGGDFHLGGGRVASQGEPKLTFSGIGCYSPQLFAGLKPGKRALAPVLQDAMKRGKISGCHFTGDWRDIGTPGRLQILDREISAARANRAP